MSANQSLAAVSIVLAACSAAPRPKPASIALAIAYSGQEMWIGNDEIEEDPGARTPGALQQLAVGIDQLELSKRATGDVGILVSYGTPPKLVLRAGPIAWLTGVALGTQRDYAGELANLLVGGVDLALHELEKTRATRKVLIVIGDGTDVDVNRAPAALARFRRRAAVSKVEVHAIVYRSWASWSGSSIEALTPNVVTIHTARELPARLASIVHQCCRPHE